MSTNIDTNALKHFIVKAIGGDKIAEKNAQKFDIEKNEFEEANVDENNYLELDEILDDDTLYEKFATMFVEDQEQKAEESDKEKEKEKQLKVKDKNGAGI